MAVLRRDCLQARRAWQRVKKKGRARKITDELGTTYKLRRRELRTEINKLKAEAWQELIGTIDKDPWGLPYRIFMRKLKTASPSMSELLEHDTLIELLDSLFPRNNKPDPIQDWSNFNWLEEWSIDVSEVDKVVRKRSTLSIKAPGPDGIKAIVWKKVINEILSWMTFLFNRCLITGEFPSIWKRANLVLILKGSKPYTAEPRLPKARPICLLDEIGKPFERVIVRRMQQWQDVHRVLEVSRN